MGKAWHWLNDIGADCLPHVDVVMSGGPERVVVDQPDPAYRPRPVGFVPVRQEQEPLLWEGDDG